MTRSKRILTTIVSLALLATPALAFYDIQSDRFHPESGTGIAIIHITDDLYARVQYIDLDGDGQYSEGDDRIRTSFFRQ